MVIFALLAGSFMVPLAALWLWSTARGIVDGI